jgi:hypothetical protein
MLRHAEWYVVADLAKEHSTSIFRVKQLKWTLLGPLDPYDKGTMILRNIRSYLLLHVMQHPRTLELQETAL